MLSCSQTFSFSSNGNYLSSKLPCPGCDEERNATEPTRFSNILGTGTALGTQRGS